MPTILIRENWVVGGFTNGADDDAKQEGVREAVLKSAGLSSDQLVTCKQVHGDGIVLVSSHEKKVFQDTDGLITDKAGIALGIFTADCASVFLTESKRKVIGLLHAGWRGTQKGIAKKAVGLMGGSWSVNPSDIKASIGPHIRDCCYEVGPEVAKFFPKEIVRRPDGSTTVSLEKAIRRQLEESGVAVESISASGHCMRCDERFFSYRRDKTEKRMLSFIFKR